MDSYGFQQIRTAPKPGEVTFLVDLTKIPEGIKVLRIRAWIDQEEGPQP